MKKLILLLTIVLTSCTANQSAKKFGGTAHVTVPKNNIFINATWKGENLWYVTKDTIENKYYLREKSSYGVIEGKIIFENSK